jgi:hypothetical protein
MDLTPEDALRINVLLAGSLKAVRIDESRMVLHALSEKGEAKIELNPNCRDESYLRRVREILSSHVLGSPGGYPVYLKRWTRMGQARDGILESLLLLGEPEAVVAVVNAAGITDELASRAWWASQTSENARCMLRQQAVVDGCMGPVLAEFLVEFLPFEEEARCQISSVQLVLQGKLIDSDQRMKLWERGRHRNAFYVGFLQTVPDELPGDRAANPAWAGTAECLVGLLAEDNPFAAQLCRLLRPAGQNYLATVEAVLKKPSNQDVMVLLEAAARGQLPELAALLQAMPEAVHHIRAMLFLALLNEPVLDPVLSRTDAIGSVMRKKLRPVTDPIQEQIDILKHKLH